VEGDVNTELGTSQLLARLTEQHRSIDDRIKQFERQRSLTAGEKLEYAQLKKQKLWAKSQIVALSLRD
jgi:uncharacterized protein YdcH (DUF465 family)